MNLRCKVCGEKAAGFHFGAFTCEGCKSFFGRCCNSMSTIGVCRNNKECVIDKKNRTSCKACRLQKCLKVGMSKSGSRYGRRSNWFKQYFQENEQRRQIDDVKSTNETDDKNIVMEHRYRRPSTSPSTKDHHRPLSKVNGSSDTIRFVTPKIYPDLVLSTPAMSSHFYANYFPHLANFSRFLTSPLSPSFNGRDSRFFLNTDCEPMSLFNGFDFRNPVSECYENTIRLTNIKCDDQELPLSRTRADDPLDLSSNSRSGIGGEQEARRTMPLDLSVK